MSGWALTVTRHPDGGHDWEWRLNGEIVLYGWDAGSRKDARASATSERREYLARQAVAS